MIDDRSLLSETRGEFTGLKWLLRTLRAPCRS